MATRSAKNVSQNDQRVAPVSSASTGASKHRVVITNDTRAAAVVLDTAGVVTPAGLADCFADLAAAVRSTLGGQTPTNNLSTLECQLLDIGCLAGWAAGVLRHAKPPGDIDSQRRELRGIAR